MKKPRLGDGAFCLSCDFSDYVMDYDWLLACNLAGGQCLPYNYNSNHSLDILQFLYLSFWSLRF
jgi:hypothetical protein